jgi:hypothetical protein
MAWCEKHRVDYVFGLTRNARLRRIIGRAMHQAKQEYRRTGKAARVFTEFFYQTRKSWGRCRRVVAKAEQIEGKENPREKKPLRITVVNKDDGAAVTFARLAGSKVPLQSYQAKFENYLDCFNPWGSEE